MKTASVMLCVLSLLLVGCPSEKEKDITPLFAQEPVLQKGYKLGGIYILNRDLFVTKGDWRDYDFTKPGDSVPTVEQWRVGVRKPQLFKVVTLLPAGTKLRVEKIIYLKLSGSVGSLATGMLRVPDVELLINPFTVSDFLSVPSYGTLCVPDERFLELSQP